MDEGTAFAFSDCTASDHVLKSASNRAERGPDLLKLLHENTTKKLPGTLTIPELLYTLLEYDLLLQLNTAVVLDKKPASWTGSLMHAYHSTFVS